MTFLDDSHNHVDATCMVSSESEETLYDTIAKSGVQVRTLMCEVDGTCVKY